MTPTAPSQTGSIRQYRLLLLVALLGVAFWAYWTTLGVLVKRWSNDPQTSHGFVVPFVALFLLWHRRAQRPAAVPDRFCWGGVVFLAAAALLRLAGTYFYLETFDSLSLLPTLAGLVVLFGGWGALRWSWPAIAYLFFLVPPPHQVETALSGPLQRLATNCSTYTLQTLGYPALAEGNVIVLEQSRIGVVEACNGLGMLGAFFATSTAVALVIQRPLLDRLIIFFSAIPVGVLMNLIRITLTGVAHQTLGSDVANRIFHDASGWMMMPLALATLALELWFLDKLLLPRHPTAPAVVPACPPAALPAPAGVPAPAALPVAEPAPQPVAQALNDPASPLVKTAGPAEARTAKTASVAPQTVTSPALDF